MLFNEALRFSEEELSLLDRIPNRLLGNPITVRVGGREFCMDYLRCLYELLFLRNCIDLDSISTVLEIGAGFGRTCHALLSTHPNIERYYIVDLPNCLGLSRRFLKSVLSSGDFDKVRFINNSELNPADSILHDLAVNIDSMAEMNEPVVRSYQKFIDRNASNFYVSNPVGKYTLQAVEVTHVDNEAMAVAMKTGILHATLDIFDSEDIARHVPAFLAGYTPGAAWKVSGHERARPWSYYHQALYSR